MSGFLAAHDGGSGFAVPGVAIVGLIVGLALLWAAIQYMFGKKKP